MGRKMGFSPQQHTLAFARREIWQGIPVGERRQCGELCERLLRAVLQNEERERSEADDDRKDSR
ncbi:MAG TPA: hypothetical protein VLX90_19760 [Steroidobacteraceae bacterium]|nr:hypothetical protein [Steroidobacteraceae bacterium]